MHHSNTPAHHHSIAYYITAHGYGHGTRSCDILRALLDMRPDLGVAIVTDLDPAFINSRLAGYVSLSSELAIANSDDKYTRVRIRHGAFDFGMVQLDSVKVDLGATLNMGRQWLRDRPARVREEAEFLRRIGAGLVVADIPSAPIEAAKAAGVPAVAVGNFGWDWIYEEFAELDPSWDDISRAIAEGYGMADLLLRLPFAEPMRAFRRTEDLPLVARPGRLRRKDLAQLTGANPDARWVLLSFTSLDWSDLALAEVEAIPDTEFFTVLPLAWDRPNIHAVDRKRMPYGDVMASCDVVVSKPGFGVLSECVVNRKPLIYTERTDFREYAVLVEALQRCLRNIHIPSADLYAGALGPYLAALDASPEPQEQLQAGGDVLAARRLLGFMALDA
jgi:hypothetical protein